MIVFFPEEPSPKTENRAAAHNRHSSGMFNTQDRGSSEPASYFPARILGYLSFQEDQDGFEVTNDLEALNIGLEKAAKCY